MINTGMCVNRNIHRTYTQVEIGSCRHSFSDTEMCETYRPLGSQAWRLSTGVPIHTNRRTLLFTHMNI